jgi:lysophospholipase L1-like esterase
MNIGDGVAYPEATMNIAMESYNDIARSLARELALPLFDLATILPKSQAYFYDDVHFNIKGAAFAGGRLADFLVNTRLVPDVKADS